MTQQTTQMVSLHHHGETADGERYNEEIVVGEFRLPKRRLTSEAVAEISELIDDYFFEMGKVSIYVGEDFTGFIEKEDGKTHYYTVARHVFVCDKGQVTEYAYPYIGRKPRCLKPRSLDKWVRV